MKKSIFILTVIAFVLGMTSCASKKQVVQHSADNSTEGDAQRIGCEVKPVAIAVAGSAIGLQQL